MDIATQDAHQSLIALQRLEIDMQAETQIIRGTIERRQSSPTQPG